MADPNWPIPKFHFSVEFGEAGQVSFQEVTGLKMTTEHIEYRGGDDPTFIKQKIPGMKKFENLTLKKGVFQDDLALYDWFKDVQTNPERRDTVTISLLDEEGNPVLTWTVINAFPVSYSGPDLNAEGNELAIEQVELAHEGIEMS